MGTTIATKDKPRFRVTADGLSNLYTGMGSYMGSRSRNNFWSYSGWLGSAMIDVIYRESWLARRICSVPAKDATRKWRRFNGENAEDIEREEKRLRVKTVVTKAKTLARAYGGAAILMLTDQPLDKPLNINRIGRGGLKRLLVLDRYDLAASQLNQFDVLAENYLLPEYYMPVHGSGLIHHSHLVRFEGADLPRRLAAQDHGWGDSELRQVLEDVNMTVASFMGIGELMQQANVDTISKAGLSDELTSGDENAILERYRLFNLMKSNYGLALLDGEEELSRLTLQLTGVAQSLEQLITWISGAAQIPVTRLFGTSAKGMSATGEGDEKVYYDRIESMQEDELRAPLQKLDQVMVRSAIDDYPDDLDFDFNPLFQLDDQERAAMEYTESQTDMAYLSARIVKPSKVMRKLQAKDTYQITDEEIEAQEQMENEPPEEPDDNFNLNPDDPNGGGNGDEPDDDSGDKPAEAA